jgi:hypothetical protein
MSMIGSLRRVPDGVLQGLLADPQRMPDFISDEGFTDLRIEKAWHGIHFLLTGTAWEGEPPLDFIVRGGVEIGDVDVGYGPARGFTSEQVGALWKALEPKTAASMRSAYDAERMRNLQIYPGGWQSADEDNLDAYFDQLRDFIEDAVNEHQALLIWLS